MKKYIKPEMRLIAFGSEDIIQTSGEPTITMPKKEVGGVSATALTGTDYAVFEEETN